MRIRLSPTDASWFRFLRDRPYLNEANFWVPSGARVRTAPGDRILFKTKAEAGSRLVGGAFVSGYNRMRVSEAWQLFAEGNGLAEEGLLRATINAWRRRNGHDQVPDPMIGCLLLDAPFFVVDEASLPQPDWYPSEAVRGMAIASSDGRYAELDAAFADLFWRSGMGARTGEGLDDLVARVAGATRGDPRTVIPRVGQQAFRGLTLTGYQRRCVITGSRIEPTLQAAHIVPVAHHGEHRLDNGLLLRADIHTMYDGGYLGIDADYRLRVSPRLRAEFGNGAEFYSREGEQIRPPLERKVDLPHRDFLTWHMSEVFKQG